MKKEHTPIHSGIGAASILMIFVVLCLTAFGVLSFSAARSDNNLSKKNAEHLQAYYTADKKAEQQLAKIDTIISGLPPKSTLQQLSNALKAQNCSCSITQKGKNFQIVYSTRVSHLQNLDTVVEISSDFSHFTIISRKLVSTQESNFDNQPLTVWQGSSQPK